jgi:hypothetical protein
MADMFRIADASRSVYRVLDLLDQLAGRESLDINGRIVFVEKAQIGFAVHGQQDFTIMKMPRGGVYGKRQHRVFHKAVGFGEVNGILRREQGAEVT